MVLIENNMHFEEKYINPLTDFGFKKLFGEEVNKDLLIDFLNELLPERHKIKDLSYQQNERLPSSEYDRKAIFDLYCVSESGENFIVELQRAKQKYFKDRSVFYATFPIQQQAKKGTDWDFKLEAVYTIGILDFTFDIDIKDERYLHTILLKDDIDKVFYDKLTFIYIELPKFVKKAEELETKIDKWIYVFKHLAKLQDRPLALQEKIFQRLFTAAEIAKYSKKDREQYEESLKYFRDIKNVVDTAHEEGKIEGKIEIAKNLKNMGLNSKQISDATGLSENEINEL
jgi:predicted transposase/invertase (TIGR01784 family)